DVRDELPCLADFHGEFGARAESQLIQHLGEDPLQVRVAFASQGFLLRFSIDQLPIRLLIRIQLAEAPAREFFSDHAHFAFFACLPRRSSQASRHCSHSCLVTVLMANTWVVWPQSNSSVSQRKFLGVRLMPCRSNLPFLLNSRARRITSGGRCSRASLRACSASSFWRAFSILARLSSEDFAFCDFFLGVMVLSSSPTGLPPPIQPN